ncbi:hypothetical protein KDX38_26660 [Pseudomonas sp. CDFA 602]|uniref:hypothetical protein n=1 Tax=Pseudomonas californiensis TaxID=2829823 RepID=UPI001E575BD4|nr:hypothetical protein [Pseudomonas californiensis]MCD5997154.1 hypothetical protein [Pseudomonas californiensis]MCD6002756.1 hypothetical protein [Pseudomonas californiensis]
MLKHKAHKKDETSLKARVTVWHASAQRTQTGQLSKNAVAERLKQQTFINALKQHRLEPVINTTSKSPASRPNAGRNTGLIVLSEAERRTPSR